MRLEEHERTCNQRTDNLPIAKKFTKLLLAHIVRLQKSSNILGVVQQKTFFDPELEASFVADRKEIDA
jgi:hypothetical protein